MLLPQFLPAHHQLRRKVSPTQWQNCNSNVKYLVRQLCGVRKIRSIVCGALQTAGRWNEFQEIASHTSKDAPGVQTHENYSTPSVFHIREFSDMLGNCQGMETNHILVRKFAGAPYCDTWRACVYHTAVKVVRATPPINWLLRGYNMGCRTSIACAIEQQSAAK